jgi:hypothetical protein
MTQPCRDETLLVRVMSLVDAIDELRFVVRDLNERIISLELREQDRSTRRTDDRRDAQLAADLYAIDRSVRRSQELRQAA